jgi:hypothetical protein
MWREGSLGSLCDVEEKEEEGNLSYTSLMKSVQIIFLRAWFKAFAAMYMGSMLFWDITQRRVVILYRRFATTFGSHVEGSRSFLDSLTLEDGTVQCIISHSAKEFALG